MRYVIQNCIPYGWQPYGAALGGRSAGLGDLPSASTCSDAVGQLQQLVNYGLDRDPKFGLINSKRIYVDGKAGAETKLALDVVLPYWQNKSITQMLTELRAKYPASGITTFSCPPPPVPTAPSPTTGPGKAKLPSTNPLPQVTEADITKFAVPAGAALGVLLLYLVLRPR